MAKLQDKVALITGAGSGIGRESALRMAEEGAAIMCADRDFTGAETTAGIITNRGGRAGVLELDAAGHRVVAGGAEIRLGPTEYRLLRFLMAHPDRVYSRAQLLDRVWGANVYVEERTVDVHVRRLRKALEEQGADAYIQTVRGAGYRFSVRGS